MIAAYETIRSAINPTSESMLRQADALLESGDKRRASGKAWDAFAHSMRTVMDRRGWARAKAGTHAEVGDMINAASRLADESDAPDEIQDIYIIVVSSYVNSLEGWQDETSVKLGIDNARKAITRLEMAI